jgi:hypothetical protein
MWRIERGARRVKEPEWEMRRIGRGGGVDRVKNWSGKCKGRGGGTNGCLKRKFFLKTKNINQTLLK